jgi:hypothetical protein
MAGLGLFTGKRQANDAVRLGDVRLESHNTLTWLDRPTNGPRKESEDRPELPVGISANEVRYAVLNRPPPAPRR